MTSLALYLLPAVLIAVFHSAAPAEDGEALSGPLARHNALRTLLRRRSLEAALSAPSLYSEQLESLTKRNDNDMWIWMPAHGFMQVPEDEVIEEKTPQKSQGTLLRYG